MKELRELWRKILRIEAMRTRRSILMDLRLPSKYTFSPTDIRGLKMWIRRRGVGVDIRGLDDPESRSKIVRRRRQRQPVYGIPQLMSADLDTLLWKLEAYTPKDYSFLVATYGGYADKLKQYVEEYEKNINIDKELKEKYKNLDKYRVFLSGYVPQDVFKEVVSGFRKIANFCSYDRKWYLDLEKIKRLKPENIEQLDKLVHEYGDKIVFEDDQGRRLEISRLLDIVSDVKSMIEKKRDVVPIDPKDPRYYLIKWGIIDKGYITEPKIVQLTQYTRHVYDPNLKRRIEKTYLLSRKLYTGYAVPRGLMDRIEKVLKEKHVDDKVLIQPFEPGLVAAFYAKTPVKLRDYQAEAVAAILYYLAKYGGATLQAATGAGKTEIAIDVVKRIMDAMKDGRKVFFLSLSTDLLRQFKSRAEKYGIPVGLVTSTDFDIDKPVIAVTVQSMHRALQKIYRDKEKGEKEEKPEDVRLEEYDVKDPRKLVKLFEDAKMIVFDEVQHVPAYTVKHVVKHARNAMRLGLSATPWRDDERDMEIYAWIGDVVPRKITSSELIEKGYLVPAYILITVYDHPDYRTVDEEAENIHGGARKFKFVEKHVYYLGDRIKWIAETAKYLKKMGFTPGLILVREKKHGKMLNEALEKEGLTTYFVSGELKPEAREKIFNLCRENKLDFIIATSLADEGLDLPPLKVLILTAGGKSKVKTLQRIGRVIRKYPGKKVGLVIDIVDNVKYFREHVSARKKMYESEPKWKIEVVDAELLPAKIREVKKKYG